MAKAKFTKIEPVNEKGEKIKHIIQMLEDGKRLMILTREGEIYMVKY